LRQAVLDGRIAGLRPAQRRRLERLSQRRHPADAVADLAPDDEGFVPASDLATLRAAHAAASNWSVE
jgi:hypothetical protein